MNHIHCIILAGGNGERLWPLSRKNFPKQLLRVEPEKSMLLQTIERAELLTTSDHIWISCAQHQVDTLQMHLPNNAINFVVEPVQRNTGPALLYTCLRIYEQDPGALIIVFPADAFIPSSEYTRFACTMKLVLEEAQKIDKIIICGVKPTYPATGYGYIHYQVIHSHNEDYYQVIRFHEKPNHEQAKLYLQQGMAWNTGIFSARLAVLLNEYKHYAPKLYNAITAYMHDTAPYQDVQTIAIDYAIMEQSQNLLFMPLGCAWYDTGTLGLFLQLKQEYMPMHDQQTITINAQRNIVDVPNTLVVLVGVNDLCVVHVDGILVVVHRDAVEQIKLVVNELQMQSLTHYL